MPASVSRPARQAAGLGRLWWIPANGHGNGLDDTAWVPILDASAETAAFLLTAFCDRDVPAYGARASGSAVPHGGPRTAEPECRLWVGASAYGRAEQALLSILPNLPGGHRHARS